MGKQLMIKPEKCISCRTCELVCSFGHTDEFNPKLSRVTVLDYEEAAISVPMMCLQCEEASCVKVCPTGAMAKDENGVVNYNTDKCIVCKLCVNACPLGNIAFSPRLGKVFKCDQCDGDPKCVKFCPSGALVFVEPDATSDRKKAVAASLKDVFGEGERQ